MVRRPCLRRQNAVINAGFALRAAEPPGSIRKTKSRTGGVSIMRAACALEFGEMLNPNVTLLHLIDTGDTIMNAISTGSKTFESTYALIVRSEEKQRSRFEIFVYALLVISTVFALSQAGRQAALMPPNIQHVATISAPELRHSA